jgi:hypothetical protein
VIPSKVIGAKDWMLYEEQTHMHDLIDLVQKSIEHGQSKSTANALPEPLYEVTAEL